MGTISTQKSWNRPELKDGRNCGLVAGRREPCRHWVPIGATNGRWLTASMLLVAGISSAQESLRNSLAGDAAAEAQRQQIGSQLYTYKAGDLRLLVIPSFEMDYNDNVTLSETGAQQDVILMPLVQLAGSYPLTQHNLLSFSAGVGYDDYLERSQYSAWRVDSGSQLSFDVYIKDVWINFHDRFSSVEDPGAEASVAGTAQYGTFNNVAGLSTTWDLEDVVLTLGYDHQNSLATSGQFNYLDRSSELPLARAGFRFNSQLTAGIEGGASFTTYDHAVLNDNQSYSAGLYADWDPGLNLHVQPRAGYTIYQFQHTSQSAEIYDLSLSGTPILAPAGESIQTADLDSWYAGLTVSHQAGKAASYAFSAGHEIRLGIQSEVVEDSYFRPSITWMIFNDINLSTSLFYEHGNQGVENITGNLVETYDWYGGGLMLSYSLMKKLMLSLNYRLTLRSSDLPDRGYAQNVVGIKLAYQPQ
ncbi:MAG: hypothetical protein ABSF38_05710 [Verrucomicrobiota bacterium]|jgi:hypothetical protein